MDLIVAGTAKKVIMIEAGANEIKEDAMYEAIMAGQKELTPAIELIKAMQAKIGNTAKINKIKKYND